MKQTALPEEDWILVGKGKVAVAEMQTVDPVQGIASPSKLCESEEQVLGKNIQGSGVRGSIDEEVPDNVETASQVSPKPIEVI
ncbi:hypothetical protein U1Q18_017961 [Sarracenia purpurea var. burkii]